MLRHAFRAVVGAVAVLIVGAAVSSTSATAGTYDVWSCKTPSGVPTSTAGWSSSSSLLHDLPIDDCAMGGRLTAKFTAAGGGVSGGLAARWIFTAPEGTRVDAAELHRSIVARGGAPDEAAVARAGVYRGAFVDDAAHRVEMCDSGSPECAAPAARTSAKIDAAAFGITAGCAGPSGRSLCARGSGSRAQVSIDSARITLRDDAAPKAEVSGAALRGRPLRGRTALRISATDVGAGVWQAEVRLGAKTVLRRTTLGSNRGRCKLLPGTRAFAWPVPCASSAAATLAVNTKGITDGSQLLTVTVWDAANNPTVAISQAVQVDNAKRIRSDGTILMPRISDPLDSALQSIPASKSGGARPLGLPSGPLGTIVSAMNTLDDAQITYCYGGGHGTTPAVPSVGSYCWVGSPAQKVSNSGAVGLDCSSSVSWVLQQAGYDIPTMDSSSLAAWGNPGEGQALTIWANASHVYLEIKIDGKSYYWGTSASNVEHGPGWHPSRSSGGFTPRSLPGL